MSRRRTTGERHSRAKKHPPPRWSTLGRYLLLVLFVATPGGVLGAAPADVSWSIRLAVRDELVDKGALTFGATPGSSAGFDALDEPHPPALPRHFLDLVTEHRRDEPGWSGQELEVMRYRAEYVAPLDNTPRQYPLLVETDAPRHVTVTWTLAPDVDLARHHAALVDTATSARVDLWTQSSLELDLAAGRRTLRLELTPGRRAPPFARDQDVTLDEDTPTPITLVAIDPEGDPISYEVVSLPAHGTLTGTAPRLTYVPDPNYSGPDSFQFRASDATGPSNVATVRLTVTPVNDRPEAFAKAVTTDEDTALVVPLPASDVDGDALAAVVLVQPQHGTVLAQGASLTYTPDADFNGTDAFTFAATDGELTSSPAQVSVTVRPVPDAPRAAFRPAGPARNVAGWNDNLASTVAGAVLVGVSSQFGGFIGELALDDNVTTRWASANGSNKNQSLTVALPGGQSRRIHRVRLVNAYDALEQATRNFEVRASNTTTADAAFTTVLTGTAADIDRVQEFVLPTPVDARFVRLVALDNHGSTCCVSVRSFEAVTEDGAGVASHGASPSYSSAASSENRPEAMLDGVASTAWRSAPGQSTNQHVIVRLDGGVEQSVDRVRVLPSATVGDPEAVKRFEVWTSTRADNGFVRALAATTANTGASQEFKLSAPVRARFVRFVALDTHGTASSVKVAGFEVLTEESSGHELSARSSVVAFSSQFSGAFGPAQALDLDPSPPAWVTANGQTVNQFVTVALPEGRSWLINRVTLQGRTDADVEQTPRDFEVQVSTTTADPSAFATVFAGTMRRSSAMQHFLFAPVEARYVRLLLKNNYGSAFMGVQVLWLGSPELGSVAARLLDESKDPEGPVSSWRWELGDGATATSRDVTHSFATPGSYEVSLSVEDSTGLRGTLARPYRAVGAPVAAFDFSPTPVDEGVPTTFRDVSTDPAGLAHRAWDFGDGQQAGTANATLEHTFGDQGVHTVRLRVANTWGAASVVTRTVEVSNAKPKVDAGADPRLFPGGTWTARPSVTDSAGDALTLTCLWDFGDGQTQSIANCTSTTASVSHVYSTAGAYTAKLTVTDKDGASASDTVKVSVYPPTCAQEGGPFLEFPWCGPYSLAELGRAPGVPTNNAGLLFKADDPNTLFISANGIQAGGAIYTVRVVRGADGHVTGFSGTATKYADVPFIDGGLVYGPGGVMFTARWPVQEVVQLRPGSTNMDKRIPLTPLGLADVSLNFVPPGFPGACELKLVNFFDARWWSASVVPDGTGTYALTSVRLATRLPQRGPEHLVYVPPGSPVFEDLREVLVTEFNANRVTAFLVDDAGDPLPDTARPVVSELRFAEAATVDPLTGDLLVVALDSGRVFQVRGFAASSRGVNVNPGTGPAVVGTPRVVTVTVTDGTGRPRVGVPVSVAVVSGPNAGATGSCVPDAACRTDTAGQVRFQYVGTSAGTDGVRASVEGDACGVVVTGTASVEWTSNRPPVAQSQTVMTPEDTALSVPLSASDPDGDALTYKVVTPPAHGVLSGTAPALTYTPAPDFHGSDAFTWVASDGKATSNEATVTLTVSPVNDVPRAESDSVMTPEDTPLAIRLRASDVDVGDTLAFEVVAPPTHGTLSGTAPDLLYTPAPDFNGEDAFRFRVGDGRAFSAEATVSISVQSVNDAPVSMGRSVETQQDQAVSFTLPASDVDGDALTYEIVAPPSHGKVQGAGPTVTYTPETGYRGADSFTFRVRDGQLASNVSTVSITVVAVSTLDCRKARPDKLQLWPPDHKLVAVKILGVTDASGRTWPAKATAVRQDEPVNGLGEGDTSPDAKLSPLKLRAERAGPGDGRIYEIDFTASDDRGGTCAGTVTVCVPHAQGGQGRDCVDSGVRYDSTRR